MKKSKVFLIIGGIMTLVAIVFIVFAVNHPEMAFIGGNEIAYPFYIVYAIITFAMFILSKRIK